MVKKAAFTKPPLFQSKLLCFSLLYLFTTLFLALYSSLSPTRCIFRSSPFDPIQSPLFSYPKSYGEHKYAVPTLRSSCISPVLFSDYWVALKEIEDFSRNSSVFDSGFLQYLSNEDNKKKEGEGYSFGGNFSSAHERFAYFDYRVDENVKQLPCGFFKEFPVSEYDRLAMEECRGVIVVSAIFGDHDKVRQPRGLGSKTMEIVCFFMFVDDHTFKSLNSNNLLLNESQEHKLGAWRIIRVSGDLPYENLAMNGVIPKHLVHRLFPNSRFSIWIDAKIQLTVDPLLLIHSLVIVEGVDMAISKHPYYIHTMEEAMATARWKKWEDVGSLRMQMETYCENGLKPWTPQKLPYPSDVPDTAIILRKHGFGSNLFSCLLFNELQAFNPRDQLAFAFVRDHMNPKLKLNMFEAEVFEQIAVEYRHNIKKGNEHNKLLLLAPKGSKTKGKIRSHLSGNVSQSSCFTYLKEMWGESHD